MIRQAGINFDALPDGTADVPLGLSSGAADIFANTGGVMEAALRTVYELVTGNPFPFANLHVKAIEGLDGIKEAEVTFEETLPEWSFLKGVTAKVAVVHTLANARIVAEKVKAGEADYHFDDFIRCPVAASAAAASRGLRRTRCAKRGWQQSSRKTKASRCASRMRTLRSRKYTARTWARPSAQNRINYSTRIITSGKRCNARRSVPAFLAYWGNWIATRAHSRRA